MSIVYKPKIFECPIRPRKRMVRSVYNLLEILLLVHESFYVTV